MRVNKPENDDPSIVEPTKAHGSCFAALVGRFKNHSANLLSTSNWDVHPLMLFRMDGLYSTLPAMLCAGRKSQNTQQF